MATIDPPAEDVAKRASQRRKDAKSRLDANKAYRDEVKGKLDSAASDNTSALETASGDASSVPAE